MKDFKEIPVEYRPVAFWSWNDRLTKEELRHQIRELAQQGWGGFFMHPRVGLLTKFNSPQWFEAVNTCIALAREEGLYAWLYDEDRWPSGYGCGEVAKQEPFRSRALVLLGKEQLTENDTVFMEYEADGETYLIAKRVSPLGDPWFNGTSFVDLMNPEAVRTFLDVVHERYKQYCGQYFGKEAPGIFTDEPSFLMHNAYDVPAYPWSEYLEAFFKERHGYDLLPHLPSLFFPVGDYEKIRYDFFDAASSLLLESFTKQYYQWCEDNGLKLVGHFMAEDNLQYQTQWTGFIMPHYEFMHYPGIDKLGRRINQNITVKQVSSVAEQLGKERTLCEVYGCIGQHCGFKERKWIADWEAISGINFVVPHLSLYSMHGERKRDFPANLSYAQPWWDDEKEFADYVSRISMVANYGRREANILVLHTIGSCWSVYDPGRRQGDRTTVYDLPFQQLTDRLMDENLDFHFGDELIMQNHARVENGKITVGNCSYDIVVVPPALTLRAETCRLLDEFSRQAPGRLLFIHPCPQRIDGVKTDFPYPDSCVRHRNIENAVAYLCKLAPNRPLITDTLAGTNASKIYCCSRTKDNNRLCFFTNTETKREIRTELSIAENRQPYLLDLSDGLLYKIPYRTEGNRMVVDVLLYANGSVALFFTDTPPADAASIRFVRSGAEFPCQTESMLLSDTLETVMNDPNVLPLNHVTLDLDGKRVAEDAPLCRLWADYFYGLPDGTPFTAEYKFRIARMPEAPMTAVIECANNLDAIYANGEKLTPLRSYGEAEIYDPEVNYLDMNFIKVPLANLHPGENIIRIEGQKVNNTNGHGGHNPVADVDTYHCTELEAIYIIGDFAVKQKNKTEFWIDRLEGQPGHHNLTESGYPFYAGKATASMCFDYQPDTRRCYLRLNDMFCCDAVLFINGKRVQELYMKPYTADVTDFLTAGKNTVEVRIAGTLFNLLGPNWRDNIHETIYISPETFQDMDRYTDEYRLLPFGIGSIEILKEKGEESHV